MSGNQLLKKCSILTALLLFVLFMAAGTIVSGPLKQIEAEYEQGKLSLDERVILEIKAIKFPDQLPASLKSTAAGLEYDELRLATPTLIRIVSEWDKLSPETQAYYQAAFARPVLPFAYDSPLGYFKMHYDTLGTDAVPKEDLDANSIPDFVEKCAAYCDSAWVKHADLGYLLPPIDSGAGGDDKYDIYFEELGFYGVTIPANQGPEPWNDYASYIELNRTFSVFAPNNDPEGDWQGSAKATSAHEFHHAVQLAYKLGFPSWFSELDATYMEDIVFDHSDDNYNFIDGFYSNPAKSLQESGPHSYASFVWHTYLAEKFDTSLNVAILEGGRYADVFETTNDTLMTRYGWTQDSAFSIFTVWNYFTNTRWEPGYFEEGAFYPLIDITRTHFMFPVNEQNSPASPAGYGSSYVRLVPSLAVGDIRIHFNGADTREWHATVLLEQGATKTTLSIPLAPGTYEGFVDVTAFEDYDRAILIGQNITEYSSGANFSYSVEKITDFDIQSEILSDSAIYSGSFRDIEYQVTNASPSADIARIIYWDDAGWVVLDTVNKALASGQDTTVFIHAEVPQSTPLGTTNTIYAKAESWGDENVFDSVAHVAEVVVQRGDVNFSGKINITDVTYLTAYLFGEGPEPVPIMLSGDFICTGTVNISDVTRLIAYLFGEGELPFCRPY